MQRPTFSNRVYSYLCVRCMQCAISVGLCNGPQICYTEGLDQGHRHRYRFSLSLYLSLSLSSCLVYWCILIVLQHASTVPLKKPHSILVYRISVFILRNIHVKKIIIIIPHLQLDLQPLTCLIFRNINI